MSRCSRKAQAKAGKKRDGHFIGARYNQPMEAAQLVAGVCALLLGRRLFWLFVGVMGFIVGVELATHVFAGLSQGAILLVAVLAGIAGAVFAVALQELMVGITGFVAGGYLGIALMTMAMPYPGRNLWLAILIGGIVGAVVLVSLFDWALIVVSALVGALLILQAIGMNPQTTPLPYLLLSLVGILVQASLFQRQRHPRLRSRLP